MLTPQLFTSRRFQVEAMRWQPDDQAAVDALTAWLGGHGVNHAIWASAVKLVELDVGDSITRPGWWVVRHVDTGHVFSLPPDVFAAAHTEGDGGETRRWCSYLGCPVWYDVVRVAAGELDDAVGWMHGPMTMRMCPDHAPLLAGEHTVAVDRSGPLPALMCGCGWRPKAGPQPKAGKQIEAYLVHLLTADPGVTQ